MPETLPLPERAQRSIGAACEVLGVSPRTLRYYEELGFLQPARTAGGHRLYGDAELEIVQRIGRMQAVGFSLGTIRRALRYRSYRDETGQVRMPLDALRALTGATPPHPAAVRERIIALQRELESAQREAEGFDHDCAFLESTLATREAEERDHGARD
jgi:MerR family transcriptional regulator, repressor of the yfmOP operon